MEKKIVYYTKHKKPIYDGDRYVAVMQDNTVIDTIANSDLDDDPKVKERFLNKVGAKNYLIKLAVMPIQQEPIVAEEIKVPTKSEKELKEEKLSKLNLFVQLDKIENKDDWHNWLKRNNIKVARSQGGIYLSKANDSIISFNWSTRGGFSCCGAKEIGSHNGSVSGEYSRYLNKTNLTIICKYIIDDFIKQLRAEADNFGVITYVVQGDVSGSSARLGILLDQTDLFVKVSQFRNPNTQRLLDIYTVSDKWKTN